MANDPVLTNNDLVGAMQNQRGRIEQSRENSARYAESFATFTSTGVGGVLVEEVFLFGCTFTSQPIVAYGWSLPNLPLDEPEESRLPQTVDVLDLPRCAGGVREWHRDARNFYVGALVYLDVRQTVPSETLVVDHDFTFTAVAFKDVPAHLLGG